MEKKYKTILNTRPFLFNETKTIAEMIEKGLKDEEIRDEVLENNVFQITSEHRKVTFFNVIKKRLTFLDSQLFDYFIHSDRQTNKIILLYAILKQDQLFYEWMREVVWDKWLILDYNLHKSETVAFMENKREQSVQIQKWTDQTINRLVNAYHQVLIDSELAVYETDVYQLQKPILDSKVREYLVNNKEKHYVEVLLGEVLE